MNKKNIILYIITSVIAISLIIMSIIIISKQNKAKYDGTIIVDVIDIDKTEIKKKEIKFKKGDSLINLISNNFNNVKYEDTGYGPFLLEIENYKTPSDFSTYISIYVDGEYSTVGIGSIELKDGVKISLKIEAYSG